MSGKKTIVCYHNQCLDGVSSAYLFQKFSNLDLVFIGLDHPAKDRQLAKLREFSDKGNDLAFADYVLPYAEIEGLAKSFDKIVVLDHHPKAENEFNGKKAPHNVTLIIDKGRCGAKITFDYLNSKASGTLTEPCFIKYVDMLDRGITSNPDYARISSVLDALLHRLDLTRSFEALDGVCQLSKEQIVERGIPLERKYKAAAKRILDNAKYVFIGNMWIPIVNFDIRAPGGRILADMAIEYAERKDNCGVFFIWCEREGVINLSVRTGKSIDAGAVARELGKQGISGDGHKQRACAQFHPKEFNGLFNEHTFACKNMLKLIEAVSSALLSTREAKRLLKEPKRVDMPLINCL